MKQTNSHTSTPSPNFPLHLVPPCSFSDPVRAGVHMMSAMIFLSAISPLGMALHISRPPPPPLFPPSSLPLPAYRSGPNLSVLLVLPIAPVRDGLPPVGSRLRGADQRLDLAAERPSVEVRRKGRRRERPVAILAAGFDDLHASNGAGEVGGRDGGGSSPLGVDGGELV